MHFLSPLFLSAGVIAAIPLLIHLLNRRRFIVVDWAPMKYLKLTIRTNRRRLQIEQLLLLFLRTVLMVLLVLTVARLALGKTGLGGWLSKRARVSRVIVIDNSLASGYRSGGKSELDAAKQAGEEILTNTGAQDAVTILTTTGTEPLVREASMQDPGKAVSLIHMLRPADAAVDWAGVLKNVDDALKSATFPQKQIVILTGMRQAGWDNRVTDLTNRWAAAGVEAKIVDVGTHATADVALTKFVQEDAVSLPGVPLKLLASIRNRTAATLVGQQATLTVDGQSRPLQLPDLGANATVDLPLTVNPSAIHSGPEDLAAQHQIRLELPDDALPGDNARNLCVTTRDKLDLTMVDGRIGAGPFESAGDFLRVALSVGQNPWHVTRLGDTDPAAVHPTPADVTVLVDAANLSSEAVAGYESLVNQGMGLIIFAGEQVDPTAYNERLWKNGHGLLPFKLDHIADEPVKGLVVEGFDDSPLGALGKIAPTALSRIGSKRYLTMQTTGKTPEGVRILARWNNAAADVAVVEKRLGRGRVLIFTTTADREWTDWPVDPTYLLAMRTAALASAWPDTPDDNAVAGHTLQVRGNDPKANPRITTPDDTARRPVHVDGNTLEYSNSARAGIYTFSWKDPHGTDVKHETAVSFDPAAADLTPLPPDQLARLTGNLDLPVIVYHEGQLAAAGNGREIWRTLAATLLGLMVVETAFAAYVGRSR